MFQGQHLKSKNHYERLEVRHDAAPADIKKSFYKLSKAHHPDANPDNPSAAQTFSLISESYSLLSDPTRRASYDRDVLRLHQQSSPNTAPRGSYHSAGGRPATGLSRRRGTFRGPPPSFYRSGGYGTHGEKRKKAHEESTTTGGSEQRGEKAKAGFGPRQHGGMGPGSDPFGHHDDVPHFDRAGNLRTQKREDHRRWQRSHRAVDEDNVEFEPQMSQGAHFVVVIVLLAISFAAPAVYLQFGRTGKKKNEL